MEKKERKNQKKKHRLENLEVQVYLTICSLNYPDLTVAHVYI